MRQYICIETLQSFLKVFKTFIILLLCLKNMLIKECLLVYGCFTACHLGRVFAGGLVAAVILSHLALIIHETKVLWMFH